jgi:hypothetical protein
VGSRRDANLDGRLDAAEKKTVSESIVEGATQSPTPRTPGRGYGKAQPQHLKHTEQSE